MRRALLAAVAVLIAGAGAAYADSLSGGRYGIMELVHAAASRLHLNDDVLLSLGNTAAAPDVWQEHDTAATPDEWALSTTDNDGGGTDGVVLSIDDGTDDLVCSGGYATAGAYPAGSATGDAVYLDNNGVRGGQISSGTTDPDYTMIRAGACAPGDGTCAAPNVYICGGQDTTIVTIDGADPSTSCAGDNDTVTVSVWNNNDISVATVLTEGTEWTTSASVADTCTSLAAAVDALAGVSATCTSPDVRILLDSSTCKVHLAESTAGCTTVSIGTAGYAEFNTGGTIEVKSTSANTTWALRSTGNSGTMALVTNGSSSTTGTLYLGTLNMSSSNGGAAGFAVSSGFSADLTAGSCTVGTFAYDTGNTDELCFCFTANTWACLAIDTFTGPTD